MSSGAHSASSAAQRSLTTKVAKSVASRTGVFTQATVLQVTNDTPNTLKQPRLESSFAGAEFERTLQFPVPPGATHMAVLQEPRRVAGAGTRARWLLEFQDVPGAIWLELHVRAVVLVMGVFLATPNQPSALPALTPETCKRRLDLLSAGQQHRPANRAGL